MFAGKQVASGVVDDKDAEIRRLKTELRDLKEDHDILKKAAAYFARDLLECMLERKKL